MAKRVLIGVILVLLCAAALVLSMFYRSDLSREELSDRYLNGSSRFMDLGNGANMHYRDEGDQDKPALVMIHGGFGSLHNWEGWIPELESDFRLISMDLLGHGLTGSYPANIYDRHTERDAVHDLLAKLGVTRYVVAGNSFGGGIALEMALAYPKEVEGLILVDSEGVPNGEDGYDTSLFNDDAPVTPDMPEFREPSFLERIGSRFLGPRVIRSTLDSMVHNKELLTDEFVDRYATILRHRGNRVAQLLMFRQGMYLISKNGKMDLQPRLKEIRCPTLILQGEQDTLVPMRVAKVFDQEIERSKLHVVAGAGHMPMIEKPQETAKLVRDFFVGIGYNE